MNDVICRYIDERMKRCEEIYDINVIAWFLRDRGMPRKNSDLDIVFLFKNRADRKCRAIHDIKGYGFDFWGWDIYDALETVTRSHEYFYLNPSAELEDIYISEEHKRGGLGYFGGLYWMVGNQQVGGNTFFLSDGVALLNSLMERKIVVNYMMAPLKARVDKMCYMNGMSSYEYLNTLWRLELSRSILEGGKPGETNFIELANRFIEGETLLHVKSLLHVYRDSLSKYSQRFALASLNAFIVKEFGNVMAEMEKLVPERAENSRDIMTRLEELVLKIGEAKDM